MKKTLRISYSFFREVFFYLSLIFLPFQLQKYFFVKSAYLQGVQKDLLAPYLSLTNLFILFFVLSFLPKIKDKIFGANFWVVFFFFCLNLIFSVNRSITLFKGALFFLFYLYVLSILEAKKENWFSYKKIALLFILVAALELFLAIYQFYFGRSFGGIFYFLGERDISLQTPGISRVFFYKELRLRPYATFSHPNSMAAFFTLVLLWAIKSSKKISNAALSFLLILLSSSLVFISFSKIAIFVSFLILSFWIFRGTKCFFCRISRFMILFLFFLIFFLTPFWKTAVLFRLQFFLHWLIVFLSNPVFGVGLGAYLSYLSKIFPSLPYSLIEPVHNIFLLFLAETGIVGFFLILYLAFKNKTVLKRFVKEKGDFLIVVFLLGSFDHHFLSLNQNLFSLILLFL